MSEMTDYGKICYWCGQYKNIHNSEEWQEHDTEWKHIVRKHGMRPIFWKRVMN